MIVDDIEAMTRQRARALGATDFLFKPFDLDEIEVRVANLLEHRRLSIDVASYRARLG